MTPPVSSSGAWLKRIAHLFFDHDTLTRVVLPTLADLDHEVREAGGDSRASRGARFRGYVAFWKLVVLSPFLFAQWPSRHQFALSLAHAGAIVVLLVVTFGARSEWMARWLVEWLPAILPALFSVADLGPYVWLLAPIAVMLLAVLGRRSPFRVAPVAVVMICGATVAAATTYGALGFVAAFDKIGSGGSAGLGVLVSAFDALAIPSLLALGIAAITATVAGISQWRGRDTLVPGSAPDASGTTAFLVLTVSMVVSLAAANQWLLMNEELLDVGLAMTSNARTAAAGGFKAVAERSEIGIPLMSLGFVLAPTMLATALAAWRGSRRPNAFLRWTTRLAIATVLIGCIWHASVIGGRWRTFHTETAATLARR